MTQEKLTEKLEQDIRELYSLKVENRRLQEENKLLKKSDDVLSEKLVDEITKDLSDAAERMISEYESKRAKRAAKNRTYFDIAGSICEHFSVGDVVHVYDPPLNKWFFFQKVDTYSIDKEVIFMGSHPECPTFGKEGVAFASTIRSVFTTEEVEEMGVEIPKEKSHA